MVDPWVYVILVHKEDKEEDSKVFRRPYKSRRFYKVRKSPLYYPILMSTGVRVGRGARSALPKNIKITNNSTWRYAKYKTNKRVNFKQKTTHNRELKRRIGKLKFKAGKK